MANKAINRNPALQTNYRLVIPGLESFSYFLTSVDLPGMNASGISSAYRDRPFMAPSNRCDYDPLNIDFIVAEDFENHVELRKWMWEFHNGTDPMWTTTKDLQMFITNSNKVPKFKIVYFNAFPTQIGSVRFDTSTSDDDVLHASATFMYQYYDMYPIK